MNVSFRSFLMGLAALVLILFAGAGTATAQICNSNVITIKNGSALDADVCLKGIGCTTVLAGSSALVPVAPGTNIPGVYGVANVTYAWQGNPGAPPPFWIPSIAMNPTGRCFDVFYDPSICVIWVFQAPGPPCLNP